MVRAKGLEPPHLSALDPKSSTSASSVTPACYENYSLTELCCQLKKPLSDPIIINRKNEKGIVDMFAIFLDFTLIFMYYYIDDILIMYEVEREIVK